MKNREELISELSLERQELLRGALNEIDKGRIAILDNQLRELEGGDSFRSHELMTNIAFENSFSIQNMFDDNGELVCHEYVSESFHDPSLDY